MSITSVKLKKTSTCLLSHPDKCLRDHLAGVERLVDVYFPLRKDKKLKELSLLCARFHDIGKATCYFQEYMQLIRENRVDEANRILVNKRKHALLSAVILYYYLRIKKKESILPSFLSFLAVKRHHTFPKDTFEDEGCLTNDEIIRKQIDSICSGAMKELGLDISLNEVKDALPFIKKEFKPFRSLNRFKDTFGEVRDFSLYTDFLSIYSSLLFADRKDAVEASNTKLAEIPYEGLRSVVDSIPQKQPIDEQRRKARDFVLSKEFKPDERIYSINLPTGLGKTFTGFLYAVKMNEFLRRELKKDFRIIYTLPFTSIIDQNFEVLKDKLKDTLGFTDSSLILKHHHLADFGYSFKGENLPFDVAKVLTEGWESRAVVTTLVQLFNAIFPKNRSEALRFSRLSRTIIILDEIQTIPVRYWKLFKEIIEELSEKLDFYVIFMTATKPKIFDDYVELAGKEFFKGLNRYSVNLDLEPKTIDEFLMDLEINKSKRYLFILNTIASSQEFYEKLDNVVDEGVLYISGAVTPFERRERLRRIKEENIRYMVSTQVVEAGVNIDFDVVVRDFAPFDSLNQSAGRCNRNAERQGSFRVVRLLDSNNKRFYWSSVYDSILGDATLEVLKGKKYLTEEEFLNLTEHYYEIIKGKSVDIERDVEPLFEAVRYLRFHVNEKGESISDINLIKDDSREEIFIQLNEEAVSIWNEMKDIVVRLKNGDRSAYRDFIKIKPKFYDFVVRVNLRKKAKPFRDDILNFYYVPLENLKDFYGVTGYKVGSLIW